MVFIHRFLFILFIIFIRSFSDVIVPCYQRQFVSILCQICEFPVKNALTFIKQLFLFFFYFNFLLFLLQWTFCPKKKDLMIFIIKSYYIILSQIDYSKVDGNNHVFEEVLHDYLLQQYALDP